MPFITRNCGKSCFPLKCNDIPMKVTLPRLPPPIRYQRTNAAYPGYHGHMALNVVIVDFSGDQGLLMAPVVAWLMENQPDAIHNPESDAAPVATTDPLSTNKCSLSGLSRTYGTALFRARRKEKSRRHALTVIC
jgi:hypothetical protein